MNGRVLLVLAAVLVAGMVAAPRAPKRRLSDKSKGTPSTSKKKRTENGIRLPDDTWVDRRYPNQVVLDLKNWDSTATVKPTIGTRTCHFTAGTDTDPYGKLTMTYATHGHSRKETSRTLRLDPNWVRFRHLEGSTNHHKAQRECSPFAGNNENLFTWNSNPTNSRVNTRPEDKAMSHARSCTQYGMRSKMLKIKQGQIKSNGGHWPNQVAMNHAAAHVEIQIRNHVNSGWATVPGAWVIPTSDEANRRQDIYVWHKLRTDLTDEHSVTAIQLPIIFAVQRNTKYGKEQMKLYGPQFQNFVGSAYPSYRVGSAYPSYREGETSYVYIRPPWQDFAADSPVFTDVMTWSYRAQLYSEIQKRVTEKNPIPRNKLKFEIYGPCQFIVGYNRELDYNRELIKLIRLIVPRFQYEARSAAGIPQGSYPSSTTSAGKLEGYVWYRRKDGKTSNCGVASGGASGGGGASSAASSASSAASSASSTAKPEL